MKLTHILVPLDLTNCATDALKIVNRYAGNSGATVTLLHVVNLNILAPENRIYDEALASSRRWLERLASEYVNSGVNLRLQVRLGNPLREILAEARELDAGLLVLPVFQVSFWKRVFTAFMPSIAEKLARHAPCPVLVLRASTSVNCQDRWDWGCPAPHQPSPAPAWEAAQQPVPDLA